MREEVGEIIDMMIDEKMGCKEYREYANEIDDEEVKKMFHYIADQEHDHYKMLKEYLERFMK